MNRAVTSKTTIVPPSHRVGLKLHTYSYSMVIVTWWNYGGLGSYGGKFKSAITVRPTIADKSEQNETENEIIPINYIS